MSIVALIEGDVCMARRRKWTQCSMDSKSLGRVHLNNLRPGRCRRHRTLPALAP